MQTGPRYWRPWGIAALALIVPLLLTACGSDDPEDGGDDGTAASDEDDADDDSDVGSDDGSDDGSGDDDGGEAAEGEPQYGGDLRLAYIWQVDSLDPIRSTRGTFTGPLGVALFDPLMEYNEEGEVVPFLAESLESSDGAQEWTLTLQEGIEFHDGTPLNAEAVVFSVERARDDPGSEVAGQLELLDSVEAVDDLTVQFSLNTPYAPFPSTLADTPGFPVSPTAVEEHGEDFAQNPVGTGAFKLESRAVGDETVLVRNDNYWRDGLPYLDRVIMNPVEDDQTRMASVETGDHDIMYTLSLPQLAEARETDGIEADQVSGNGGPAINYNTTVEPLDDMRVRRALSHAIDPSVINDVIFDGVMVPSDGHMATDSPWHVETPEAPDYDPDQARALLEEAGYGDGLELTYRCHGADRVVRTFEITQQMWAEVGVDAELETMEVQEYVQGVREIDYQTGCWTESSFVDPDPTVYDRYHSESDQNYRGYENERVDELLEEARVTVGFDERYELYAEVQQILAEEQPVYIYGSRSDGAVFGDHVKGVNVLYDSDFDPSVIWMDQE